MVKKVPIGEPHWCGHKDSIRRPLPCPCDPKCYCVSKGECGKPGPPTREETEAKEKALEPMRQQLRELQQRIADEEKVISDGKKARAEQRKESFREFLRNHPEVVDILAPVHDKGIGCDDKRKSGSDCVRCHLLNLPDYNEDGALFLEIRGSDYASEESL